MTLGHLWSHSANLEAIAATPSSPSATATVVDIAVNGRDGRHEVRYAESRQQGRVSPSSRYATS